MIAKYLPEDVFPPPRNRQANSTHRLSRREIQQASTDIRRFVEARFESDLHLFKVSGQSRPLIARTNTKEELD
jgi:hypothetical protein